MNDITYRLIGSGIWGLSFIIDLIVLVFFWRDKVSRLAGSYAMKPFIVQIICDTWLIPLMYDLGIITPYRSKIFEFSALSRIADAVLYSIVEILLIIFFAYYFRDLYKSNAKICWWFIVLDCFRWIVINLARLVIFTDSQFDYIYQIYAYGFVWYFVYSVLALGLGINRSKKMQFETESTTNPL